MILFNADAPSEGRDEKMVKNNVQQLPASCSCFLCNSISAWPIQTSGSFEFGSESQSPSLGKFKPKILKNMPQRWLVSMGIRFDPLSFIIGISTSLLLHLLKARSIDQKCFFYRLFRLDYNLYEVNFGFTSLQD